MGIYKNGGWANYCRVPASIVYKLSNEVPLAYGVFIEPMSCILSGWKQLDKVKPDANMLCWNY